MAALGNGLVFVRSVIRVVAVYKKELIKKMNKKKGSVFKTISKMCVLIEYLVCIIPKQ